MFRDFDRADWGFFLACLAIVTADAWWTVSALLVLCGAGLFASGRR